MNINETMFLSSLLVLGVHMNSRESAKMGDILATEADLLGMIMEVTNLHLWYIHNKHDLDTEQWYSVI